MLSAMVDWQGISYSIKKGYWGDEYFASEIMKDSFELAKLEHLEDVKIKYILGVILSWKNLWIIFKKFLNNIRKGLKIFNLSKKKVLVQ